MSRTLYSLLSTLTVLALFTTGSCGLNGCPKYASSYSCSYVEDRAEYEVWYWRNIDENDEDDNKLIGHAIGLRMCEENARNFALLIGEEFDYHAYICVLMDNGTRMEKHRIL